MPKPHPTDQRPIIRELVIEIETVRQKRQLQWREGNHPENKRFSQEELRDLACPSYKHLLLGNTQRLPSRALVLQIADYLECTIHETNDLLLAAQYLPEVVELRSDEERVALERGRLLVATSPLPALMYRRGGWLEAINDPAAALHNFTSLTDIPPHKRSVAHWLFDTTLPSYSVHASNQAVWHHNAVATLTTFRTLYRAYRREGWFVEQIAHYRTLPEFATIWDAVGDVLTSSTDIGHQTVIQTSFLASTITENNYVVPLGSADAPFVLIASPADSAAHCVYRQVGVPVRENRWEHALREGGVHA